MSKTQTINHLIEETSPYLLQHAYNPVDWYPWGDEAFKKAKKEDKPILLSCGYSACHWCHVMERESFENTEIAGLMNQYFVNVKVDREERPDIDQIYQEAVQLMIGQGGWPLTIFLDHTLKPFFGGTYFPPVSMYGRAGFPEVLTAIHEKWENDRDTILQTGKEILEYLQPESKKQSTAMPAPEIVMKSASDLLQIADEKYGGFGRTPKFPNPMLLQLFFKAGTAHRQNSSVEHALFTLRQMARGGVYDQLGGGFHRYSTDQFWLVPHFEKMLYDNAQLIQLYTIGYQLTHSEEFKAVVKETTYYIRREMTSPEGGFYATQDADSEGIEGKYFLWTLQEIKDILEPEEAKFIIDYYQVTEKGNFEGKNILNRLHTSQEEPQEPEKLNQVKEKLLQAREKRIKPFRDEKVIVSWNGLMISGLAYAYQVFQSEEDYQSAKKAAEFIINLIKKNGERLYRVYKDGRFKIEAMLDDYAFLAKGLLDLYETDFDEKWLKWSMDLTKTVIKDFGTESGKYYLTRISTEKFLSRPISNQDQAIPSGISVHGENSLRLAALTGEKEFGEEAEKVLKAYNENMREDFWSRAGLIGVLDAYYQGYKEFTFITGEWQKPVILMRLQKEFIPYRVITWGTNDEETLVNHPARELLKGRIIVDSKPTCYFCENFSCHPPLNEWSEIKAALEKV